jgi:hypothetical protein
MDHTYRVEVLEQVDDKLVLIYHTQTFAANYADARSVLSRAADEAVKAITQLDWVSAVEVQPLDRDAVRITWHGALGSISREVDLVRVGDAQ